MTYIASLYCLDTFSLNEALGPLLFNLPKTLTFEGHGQHPGDDMQAKDDTEVVDLENFENDFDFEFPETSGQEAVVHGEQTTRAVEGGEAAVAFVSSSLKAMILSKIKTSIQVEGFDGWVGKVNFWTKPDFSGSKYQTELLHQMASSRSVCRLHHLPADDTAGRARPGITGGLRTQSVLPARNDDAHSRALDPKRSRWSQPAGGSTYEQSDSYHRRGRLFRRKN